MITAIIIFSLAAIKDEITDFIDLFAILRGDATTACLNTAIITGTFLLEMRYVSVYKGSWSNYFFVVGIVMIIAGILKYFLVKFKSRFRNFIKRKRISTSMKRKWAAKKEVKKNSYGDYT